MKMNDIIMNDIDQMIALNRPCIRRFKKECIFEYIRERVKGMNGRQKVGVIVGFIDDNNIIRIGFSKANLKAGDEFDADYGLDLAIARAFGWEINSPDLPVHLVKMMNEFEKRCVSYFKQAEFLLRFRSSQTINVKEINERKNIIDRYIELERRFLLSKGKDVNFNELVEAITELTKREDMQWLFDQASDSLLSLIKEQIAKSKNNNLMSTYDYFRDLDEFIGIPTNFF